MGRLDIYFFKESGLGILGREVHKRILKESQYFLAFTVCNHVYRPHYTDLIFKLEQIQFHLGISFIEGNYKVKILYYIYYLAYSYAPTIQLIIKLMYTIS